MPGTSDFLSALGYTKENQFDGLEIRILGERKEDNRSLWPPDGGKMGQQIKKANEAGQDVYFGVCRRWGNVGDAAHLLEAMCLWQDLDGKNWDKEDPIRGKQLILDALKIRLPEYLQPSIIIDSGHGVHLYFLLVEPWPLADQKDRVRFTAHLRGLAHYLGSDMGSTDPARIMRLPGTMNVKEPTKPVPCTILSFQPDHRINPSDLDAVCTPDYDGAESGKKSSATEIPEKVTDGERNTILTSLAGTNRRRGIGSDIIYTLLVAVNEARCNPPLPDNELRIIASGITRYQPSDPLSGKDGTKQAPPLPAHTMKREIVLHSDQLERLLIASMIANGCANMGQVARLLQPDDFHNSACGQVWACMIANTNGSGLLDLPLLQALLIGTGDNKLAEAIAEWCKEPSVDLARMMRYAEVTLDFSNRRRLESAAADVRDASYNLPSEKAAEFAMDVLAEAAQRRSRVETGDLAVITERINLPLAPGISTGFPFLDASFGGSRKGDFIVVGGYRGTGKSYFFCNIALAAAKQKKRVLYLSLEDSANKLALRMMGNIANTDWRKLESANSFQSGLWITKQDAIAELMKLQPYLRVFERQRSLAAIRLAILANCPDIVLLDYVQHLPGDKDMYKRVANNSLALQDMAAMEGVCMWAASQISIEQAMRGRKGLVKEYKGAGELAADATVALFTFRDFEKSPNVINLWIEKNHNGADHIGRDYSIDLTTGRLAELTTDTPPESECVESHGDEIPW